MTPLSIAYVATAAICALVALQHLVVAFRVPERRMPLLFALASCGVAGDAFVSRATYNATHAQEFLYDQNEFEAASRVQEGAGATRAIRTRSRVVNSSPDLSVWVPG